MEKQNDLFQDQSQEERLESLKQMATRTDSEPIRRVFSHDEKQQIKDSLASDSITLREKKKEFAAIKKEFDKAAKAYAEQIGMACDDLKRGYTENEEPVFLMDDQDNGMMHTFDQWGKFIKSRKLYPDERQATILSMDKTGTND